MLLKLIQINSTFSCILKDSFDVLISYLHIDYYRFLLINEDCEEFMVPGDVLSKWLNNLSTTMKSLSKNVIVRNEFI